MNLSLLRGLCLSAFTAAASLTAFAQSADPDNTLVMTLKDECKVTIALRPDLAPKHVEQIKTLTSFMETFAKANG